MRQFFISKSSSRLLHLSRRNSRFFSGTAADGAQRILNRPATELRQYVHKKWKETRESASFQESLSEVESHIFSTRQHGGQTTSSPFEDVYSSRVCSEIQRLARNDKLLDAEKLFSQVIWSKEARPDKKTFMVLSDMYIREESINSAAQLLELYPLVHLDTIAPREMIVNTLMAAKRSNYCHLFMPLISTLENYEKINQKEFLELLWASVHSLDVQPCVQLIDFGAKRFPSIDFEKYRFKFQWKCIAKHDYEDALFMFQDSYERNTATPEMVALYGKAALKLLNRSNKNAAMDLIKQVEQILDFSNIPPENQRQIMEPILKVYEQRKDAEGAHLFVDECQHSGVQIGKDIFYSLLRCCGDAQTIMALKIAESCAERFGELDKDFCCDLLGIQKTMLWTYQHLNKYEAIVDERFVRMSIKLLSSESPPPNHETTKGFYSILERSLVQLSFDELNKLGRIYATQGDFETLWKLYELGSGGDSDKLSVIAPIWVKHLVDNLHKHTRSSDISQNDSTEMFSRMLRRLVLSPSTSEPQTRPEEDIYRLLKRFKELSPRAHELALIGALQAATLRSRDPAFIVKLLDEMFLSCVHVSKQLSTMLLRQSLVSFLQSCAPLNQQDLMEFQRISHSIDFHPDVRNEISLQEIQNKNLKLQQQVMTNAGGGGAEAATLASRSSGSDPDLAETKLYLKSLKENLQKVMKYTAHISSQMSQQKGQIDELSLLVKKLSDNSENIPGPDSISELKIRDDWYCSRCANLNKSSNERCTVKECRAPRPPDNWKCESCGSVNHPDRSMCFYWKCGTLRPGMQLPTDQELKPNSTSELDSEFQSNISHSQLSQSETLRHARSQIEAGDGSNLKPAFTATGLESRWNGLPFGIEVHGFPAGWDSDTLAQRFTEFGDVAFCRVIHGQEPYQYLYDNNRGVGVVMLRTFGQTSSTLNTLLPKSITAVKANSAFECRYGLWPFVKEKLLGNVPDSGQAIKVVGFRPSMPANKLKKFMRQYGGVLFCAVDEVEPAADFINPEYEDLTAEPAVDFINPENTDLMDEPNYKRQMALHKARGGTGVVLFRTAVATQRALGALMPKSMFALEASTDARRLVGLTAEVREVLLGENESKPQDVPVQLKTILNGSSAAITASKRQKSSASLGEGVQVVLTEAAAGVDDVMVS